MPTPKGVSGNPNGRTPNERRISFWLQEELDKILSNDESKRLGYEQGLTMRQAVARRFLEIAMSKKDPSLALNAMKEAADRTEGRASQSIDHTSLGEKIVIPILGGASVIQPDNSDKEDPTTPQEN